MPQRGVRGKAARRFAFCRSDAQIAGMTRRHTPVRATIRRLARLALALLLLASLGGSFLSLRALARDPALHLLVERGAEEYRAAVDAALARRATEGRVAGLLSGYLAASPRDWVALRAVERVAAERGLPLHPTLVGRIEAAWAEDTAPLRLAADCAACAWDMGNCSLSQGLICNAPVTLSPVGDMLGLARQSGNWWAGAEVDRLDLALSAVGLGATALTIASAGTSSGASLPVKAGASGLRLAKGMRLMNPRLTARLLRVADEALDPAALRAARSLDDLGAAIRPAARAEITGLATGLVRMQGATDPTTALRLMPHIDDAADAARLARGAEALGARTLGAVEVLGKARFLRLGLRVSKTGVLLGASLAGLIAALAGLAGHLGQSLALRLLRRAVC